MRKAQLKNIYLNKKQLAFIQATQEDKGFCGGRGVGKSTLNGAESAVNVLEMPKSKGAILGLTYNQIMTKFLPPMTDMWKRMGFRLHTDKEPGHYIIGKKPPDHWERAWQEPEYYQNVISLWNGSRIELLSFDRKNANLGGNYDWLKVDEAQTINKDRFDKEIRPTVRGNKYRYTTPRHHSVSFTGSMPWLPSGMWFPDMLHEAKKHPKKVFYMEATAWDNVDVLGENYIRRLERTLPFLVYEVEVMNKRITKLPNCFYDEFEESRHCYITHYEYSDEEDGIKITDTDYDRAKELDISMDFNAKFTSLIVGQEHLIPNWECRIINEFWEKRDINSPVEYDPALEEHRDIISRTVQKFIDYYKGHKPYIRIWGDRNGNNATANSALTFYQQIEKQLKIAGFNVVLMVERRLDPLHQLKHLVINSLLRGSSQLPKIKINAERCKNLIISIQASPLTPDFKKDKSSETQEIPQERATHLSDCFDNLIYPKYSHLIERDGGNVEDPYFT
jgi:hypothetical protein